MSVCLLVTDGGAVPVSRRCHSWEEGAALKLAWPWVVLEGAGPTLLDLHRQSQDS